jgi:hypothetical protein
MDHAQELGGDPVRVAIAGESAGGNLATTTCLEYIQQGWTTPIHQLLVYPVVDAAFDTPSYRVPTPRCVASHTPRRSTIVLAEIDPLYSEGEAQLAASDLRLAFKAADTLVRGCSDRDTLGYQPSGASNSLA